MTTLQLVLVIAVVVIAALYLMKRRTRLRKED